MTTDAVGGVWSYALELCRGLERHGVEVTLAAMGPPPGAAQRDELRALPNVALVARDFRLEWMAEPWEDVAAAGDWLLELERQVAPDVVHLNGYVHAALPWSAPRLVVAHSCVLSWWRAVHGTAAPPEWHRYRDAVERGVHAADIVVAPTQTMLGEIGAAYGAPRDGRVVGNGCAAELLPLGVRSPFGRYAAAAAQPAPVVLAAGRLWDPAKNMVALAAAAPLIRWPVHVAGATARPDGKRRQLSGVHHLGSLTRAALRRWYARAPIFVHPALYEPFGLAPLEAALARTALVLADLPSLREVWGDAALFVPPQDPTAIAAAVNGLIADPVHLARSADAAYGRARTMSARSMAAAYLRIYRELGSRPRHGTTEVVACAS